MEGNGIGLMGVISLSLPGGTEESHDKVRTVSVPAEIQTGVFPEYKSQALMLEQTYSVKFLHWKPMSKLYIRSDSFIDATIININRSII
jgi:hypothetical protein